MIQIKRIEKPAESSPAFFQRYIDLVPEDGQLLSHLQEIIDDTVELVNSMPPEKLSYRYEPGKWTIKDVLVHLMDAERIFTYRALRIGRHDETPLPGFDERSFAEFAHANDREITGILEEFKLLRASTIAFIESFDEQDMQRTGTASGNKMSALTLLNLVYGHHKHHWNIIHERYI